MGRKGDVKSMGSGTCLTCCRRRDTSTPQTQVRDLVPERSGSAINRDKSKGQRVFWVKSRHPEGRGDVSHLPPVTFSVGFQTIQGSGRRLELPLPRGV